MPPEPAPLPLTRLQAGFAQNALVDSGLDGAQPPPASDLAAAILANGIAAEDRLAIHRNHFAASIVGALAGIFEATRALVGEDFFESAARRFARAMPPTSPCLFEYGADFPPALKEIPALKALPAIPAVAKLEWAMHESFHAPAAPILTAKDLAAVSAEALADLSLKLHPTLRIVEADFPVDALWAAAITGDVAGDETAGAPVKLMLTRPCLDVGLIRIDGPTAAFLDRLRGGAAFGAAAETEGFDLAAVLPMLLERGAFEKF